MAAGPERTLSRTKHVHLYVRDLRATSGRTSLQSPCEGLPTSTSMGTWLTGLTRDGALPEALVDALTRWLEGEGLPVRVYLPGRAVCELGTPG